MTELETRLLNEVKTMHAEATAVRVEVGQRCKRLTQLLQNCSNAQQNLSTRLQNLETQLSALNRLLKQ